MSDPGSGIITPSPILTPKFSSTYTLSEQINAATRPTHSQLNRLIVARLPLALPPHSSNPNTYVTGLIYIASIYQTFEKLWQTILDRSLLPTALHRPSYFDACDPDSPLIDSNTSVPSPLLQHKPRVCTRTHSLLTHLHLPGLLRAERLRSDIRVLSGMSDEAIEERLERVSQDGPLADFVTHIKHSVETNPHVLLAYAWVLYMALFSGGRYLRLSLYAAGPIFWGQSPVMSPFAGRSNPFSKSHRHGSGAYDAQHATDHRRKASHSDSFNDLPQLQHPSRGKLSRSETTSPAPPNPSPGLEFFNFIGTEDGEDIKLEFKKRIAEAEILLTPGEKDDIIQEAQDIFKFMVGLVHELDGVCQTVVPSEEESSESSEESSGSVVKTPWTATCDENSSTESFPELLDKPHKGKHLAFSRSRDSVVINHDRIRKRNHSSTTKDSLPPEPALLKRPTTIAFKGQNLRKMSLAVVTVPFEKIVRWGGIEMMSRKFSMAQVRRMSTVKFDGKVVLGSTTVIPLLVVLVAVMALWLLRLFGRL